MNSINKLAMKLIVIFTIISAGLCDVPPIVDTTILTQTKSLGDCQACKMFIESFKKGIERTSRGKFEGGDAAWEEEKLKVTYKRSEMRLIDIQEGICKEKIKHSVQCHHMAEKAEELIEQWWSQDPDESDDLYTFICKDGLKVCCPPHHFGKDCSPCPGDHENLCNGNGKCRGDGTRKGNGTCLCDAGYTGEHCDQCMVGYYLSYKDDTKMRCIPCHMSCMGGCTQGTNKDCVLCRPGYKLDKDEGCLDINECEDKDRCAKDEFCLNSIGSYSCFKCDKSCDRCHGDGPDMCRRCAKGYTKNGEFCVTGQEFTIDQSLEKMTSARNEEL